MYLRSTSTNVSCTNPVANIKALETIDHSPFVRDREKPGPCAFRRNTGDNASDCAILDSRRSAVAGMLQNNG